MDIDPVGTASDVREEANEVDVDSLLSEFAVAKSESAETSSWAPGTAWKPSTSIGEGGSIWMHDARSKLQREQSRFSNFKKQLQEAEWKRELGTAACLVGSSAGREIQMSAKEFIHRGFRLRENQTNEEDRDRQ